MEMGEAEKDDIAGGGLFTDAGKIIFFELSSSKEFGGPTRVFLRHSRCNLRKRIRPIRNYAPKNRNQSGCTYSCVAISTLE